MSIESKMSNLSLASEPKMKQTLLTEDSHEANTTYMAFRAGWRTAQTLNKLKKFKSYLTGPDAPYRAFMISGIVYIVDADHYNYKLQPYLIDFDDIGCPQIANITIYYKNEVDLAKHLKFSKWYQFIRDLQREFCDKTIEFKFEQAYIEVQPSMGYTNTEWLQFTYKSSGSLVYWEYDNQDLFSYEESPYRFIALGGTGYILRKEDCPKHWKVLCTSQGKRFIECLSSEAFSSNDEYKYENKKKFQLSWVDDPKLQLALSTKGLIEGTVNHITGSFKFDGCSIVWPGRMNAP